MIQEGDMSQSYDIDQLGKNMGNLSCNMNDDQVQQNSIEISGC